MTFLMLLPQADQPSWFAWVSSGFSTENPQSQVNQDRWPLENFH